MTTILVPKYERKPLLLRQFPGKRNFSKVSSLDDLDLQLPVKDKDRWGHICRLDAGLRVFAPDGELLRAMRWPAKSYTRNFARIMRNILGGTNQLVDRTAVNRNTPWASADSNGIIGSITLPPSLSQANSDGPGAIMAVGDGVAAEDHTRDDLVSPALQPAMARNGVRTTTQDATTITHQIDAAISNGGSSSVNVTEIALFYRGSDASMQASAVGLDFLLAYDGVTSTPVAAGGSIAPRYILDFPV